VRSITILGGLKLAYTHGTKWTDDLIKERILEVVSALGIDRMPSEKECKEYYHNSGLSNAISRREGWYALAAELGLQVKKSETFFGKLFEQAAQEQLISRGYEVRRMPQNFPYDLLVNDCVKIDVKASKLYRSKNGNFYSFNLEKPFCTCDIYMLYLLNDDSREKELIILPSKYVATQTQIGIGESTSKYHEFIQKWGYIAKYCDFLKAV
jgi:hypothetical protein